MASLRKRGSVWYFKFSDATGRRIERKGCADKRATQDMARAAETEATQVKAGLIDHKTLARREHEARPIANHLDDFERSLLAKGDTRDYALMTKNRVAKILKRAGVRRVTDLSLSKTLEAMADLRCEEDWSPGTFNHCVRAAKGFVRWLYRDGRIREHVLDHLETVNAEGDRRRRRRALTVDECRRLVVAAHGNRTVMLISGPDRAMCYEVAMSTGLRASELGSLRVESFDLESDRPTVTVKGCYTKNRAEAVMLLPPTLAARLRPWVAARPTDKPVFRLGKRTAEMLRVDLEAAGIPYETSAGTADFHSLRGVFISNLVASGASVKTCQTLARHSTPALTIGIYAKASVDDLDRAVSGLPVLTPHGEDHAVASINDRFATNLPPTVSAASRNVSDADATTVISPSGNDGSHEGQGSQELPKDDGPCRIQTGDDIARSDGNIASFRETSEADSRSVAPSVRSSGLRGGRARSGVEISREAGRSLHGAQPTHREAGPRRHVRWPVHRGEVRATASGPHRPWLELRPGRRRHGANPPMNLGS